MDQYSDDPADLFVQLYDELDEESIRSGAADEWFDLPRFDDVAALVEDQAFREGRLDPQTVAEQLDIADDRNERLLAYLLGLDRALMLVHPSLDTEDRGAMLPIAVRLRRTGRLSTEAVDGALLPRQGLPARLHLTEDRTGVETKADQFVGVVRVSGHAWRTTDHVVIPRVFDLPASLIARGIHVGCAPMAQDPDDFRWETERRGGRRLYRIAPKDGVDWASRIESVLRRLDEQGAAVGVMPELTLNERLLELWQQTIVENPPPVDSQLAWILAGTGPFGDGDPPANRAVVLCRRTGRVLLTQDKCHPFLLSSEQIAQWGLTPFLGGEPANEDIAHGARITIAESAVGRFVALICEDLARIVQLGKPLIDHGVSHVLAPVFSKPTDAHYWEHSAAKVWAQAAGAQVIVSNSLVVATAMGVELPAGVCLAHGPEGFHAGSASEATDVQLLRVTSDVGVRVLQVDRER